jgi:hypothetical protein
MRPKKCEHQSDDVSIADFFASAINHNEEQPRLG